PAPPRFSGPLRVHPLFTLRGVSRQPLPIRSLSLALLFTRSARRRAARLVWRTAPMDTGVGHRRHADPLGAGRIPAHLLLLSRSLLQSILGGPAFLHGRRASQDVHRRALVSADHPKCPSLFSLPRARVHCPARA